MMIKEEMREVVRLITALEHASQKVQLALPRWVVTDLGSAEISGSELKTVVGSLCEIREELKCKIQSIKAQTKPERMAEPERFGAIVEARLKEWETARRHRWALVDVDSMFGDWHAKGGYRQHWSDLIDPVLIRDGI